MRPGSSTGTLSVSTALSPTPHSPLAPPSHDLASGPTVPYYSDVNRTTEAPSNGTSSTVVYSETSISMVGANTHVYVQVSCLRYVFGP